jgi:hypothetical protein
VVASAAVTELVDTPTAGERQFFYRIVALP